MHKHNSAHGNQSSIGITQLLIQLTTAPSNSYCTQTTQAAHSNSLSTYHTLDTATHTAHSTQQLAIPFRCRSNMTVTSEKWLRPAIAAKVEEAVTTPNAMVVTWS